MMPTSGTMTTSLNWIRWMNQTKIHVPAIAARKAKMARPHSVDDGMNNSASRIPNCADEIVAPVVGETNLFMHSCCMIRPATLMPTPVHKIASRRGRREMSRISICSRLPLRISAASRSSTPSNSDASESATSAAASSRVSLCSLMVGAPLR